MKTEGNDDAYPTMCGAGFTKRESMATQIFSGMQTNPIWEHVTPEEMAECAVKATDMLIVALNEETRDV